MNEVEQLFANIPEIEKRLQYTFRDKQLLFLAFVHKSFINENRELIDQHNERLEFLGDSVFGLLISTYLYKTLPNETEGYLSHLKSQIVEAAKCAVYTDKLNVVEYVLLGRGERMNEGRGRESIMADLFESILGAIYLDGGLEAAQKYVFYHFTDAIQVQVLSPVHNYKSLLQDYSQKKFQKPPEYKVLEESGPDHAKTFLVAACIMGEEKGLGKGSSKKEAEQAAAKDALEKLQEG